MVRQVALSPADIDLDNKIISINRTYQRIGGKDVFTSPKTRKSKRRECPKVCVNLQTDVR
jgi:hypothetical protein